MRTQDCLVVPGAPVTPMLRQAFTGPKVWTRDSIGPADWTFPLPAAALQEIDALVAALRSDPLPTLMCSPALFRLEACRAVMQRVRDALRDGIGLAVVERLPLDALSVEEARTVYWVLGQFVERLVAQKWDGTMIYDVTDTGRKFQYGVRGSWTNVELVFHTDNAFAVAPPTYVSLLCLHPAQSGGVSRFCSLYAVHNRMLERHPRLLARLYEPFYYDRQAEHAPGAPKVSRSPVFRFDGQRLHARLAGTLVRKGYALMEAPLDAMGAEALAALDDVLADESLWAQFTIERGQMQYLNNSEFAHFRSEFEDGPEGAPRRHLVRLWYRGEGRPSYDG